eukprot:Hpha_TRINITY_DN15051_c0_g1::TRINITY_DN15051_c0_g1_i1::g.123340::m.123340
MRKAKLRRKMKKPPGPQQSPPDAMRGSPEMGEWGRTLTLGTLGEQQTTMLSSALASEEGTTDAGVDERQGKPQKKRWVGLMGRLKDAKIVQEAPKQTGGRLGALKAVSALQRLAYSALALKKGTKDEESSVDGGSRQVSGAMADSMNGVIYLGASGRSHRSAGDKKWFFKSTRHALPRDETRTTLASSLSNTHNLLRISIANRTDHEAPEPQEPQPPQSRPPPHESLDTVMRDLGLDSQQERMTRPIRRPRIRVDGARIDPEYSPRGGDPMPCLYIKPGETLSKEHLWWRCPRRLTPGRVPPIDTRDAAGWQTKQVPYLGPGLHRAEGDLWASEGGEDGEEEDEIVFERRAYKMKAPNASKLRWTALAGGEPVECISDALCTAVELYEGRKPGRPPPGRPLTGRSSARGWTPAGVHIIPSIPSDVVPRIEGVPAEEGTEEGREEGLLIPVPPCRGYENVAQEGDAVLQPKRPTPTEDTRCKGSGLIVSHPKNVVTSPVTSVPGTAPLMPHPPPPHPRSPQVREQDSQQDVQELQEFQELQEPGERLDFVLRERKRTKKLLDCSRQVRPRQQGRPLAVQVQAALFARVFGKGTHKHRRVVSTAFDALPFPPPPGNGPRRPGARAAALAS